MAIPPWLQANGAIWFAAGSDEGQRNESLARLAGYLLRRVLIPSSHWKC